MEIEIYANLLKSIFKIKDSMMLYTDGVVGKQDPPVRGAGYEPVLSRRSI